MASGGKRNGAGRKAGAATQKTREIAERLMSEGITPLEYMLTMMRDEAQDPAIRMDAAKSCAPYVHPRLAAIEHSGDLNVNHESALDALK
jgi:hypothetical protein